MYAILLDRNKQYIVNHNSVINVDFMNVAVDTLLDFDTVLLFNNGELSVVGSPYVSNKVVKVKVLGHFKDDKKIILKFRRRKHHMKRIGHRQKFTKLKVFFIGDK